MASPPSAGSSAARRNRARKLTPSRRKTSVAWSRTPCQSTRDITWRRADRIWRAARPGYLPLEGGGRLVRPPKSAIADFSVYLGQVGNIRLGLPEPGGG